MSGELRTVVRVRPGASRVGVGGRYGDDQLVVAVAARAVDGAANKAVVQALADAFGVRRADVEIISGHTARSKTISVRGDPEALERRLTQLRGGGKPATGRRGE
jgi:uncharacterized protein (TIGR00251 family)